MQKLNDDCQLIILKYLNLTDQLRLFEVAKGTHLHRINSNLRYIWEHQRSFELEYTQFDIFDENPRLLHDFLSIISPTAQVLYLWGITWDSLSRWSHFQFLNMKFLSYRLIFSHFEYDNNHWKEANSAIQLLSKICPNLIYMKPDCRLDLMHLGNWMDLRSLDLMFCNPVSESTESAKGIEGLQTLEKLAIYNHQLSEDHFKKLISLPKLRKLSFKCPTNLPLGWLIKMRAKDITEIAINNIKWNELPDVKQMTNLRQVTFICLEINILGELKDFIKSLPLLERLDITESPIFDSEIELWQTVDCCPGLKIFAISDMEIDEDFFALDRSIMKRVLNERSGPLTLHCYDTGYSEDLIRLYFKHPNLKVSFERITSGVTNQRVQLQLNPTTIST